MRLAPQGERVEEEQRQNLPAWFEYCAHCVRFEEMGSRKR
jgi:hypothetical protein